MSDRVVGTFVAEATLRDCPIVAARKSELQASSPANLATILGPRAFDESHAAVPLKELLAHDSKVMEGKQEATDFQLEKIRYGATERAGRKPGEEYDGSQPLAHLGHEAVAEFLATPKAMRAFPTVAALAADLKVTRMTIHRWKRNDDVLRRAYWLMRGNQMLAIIIALRELPDVMESVAAKALKGNISAARFLYEVALDPRIP